MQPNNTLYYPATSIYRRQLLLWLILLMLGMIFMLLSPIKSSAMSAGAIISLTNQQRAANGVAPLQYNGALSSSAYAKASDMFTNNYWAHISPSGTGPWYFIGANGYPYLTAGENLAKDFPSDDSVVAGWMNSPTHRQNMLNPDFRDIGIAVVSGTLLGAPTTLVVAHYGAMAVAPPSPAPAPAPVAVMAPVPVPESVAPATTTGGPSTETAAPPPETAHNVRNLLFKKATTKPSISKNRQPKISKPTFLQTLIAQFDKAADINGLYVAMYRR